MKKLKKVAMKVMELIAINLIVRYLAKLLME